MMSDGKARLELPLRLGPDVDFASKTEVELTYADFRSTLKSRHPAVPRGGPLRADGGPDRRIYSARLKTASRVTSLTKGLLNFNSISVSDVMLRFSEEFPVRFANVLA
jgi:hypothetical protein